VERGLPGLGGGLFGLRESQGGMGGPLIDVLSLVDTNENGLLKVERGGSFHVCQNSPQRLESLRSGMEMKSGESSNFRVLKRKRGREFHTSKFGGQTV